MEKSIGTLQYEIDPIVGEKIFLTIDKCIVDYARSLVPKYIKLNKQKYAPHISVLRKEQIKNKEYWMRYQNFQIEFEYNMEIFNDESYYWIRAYSNRLIEIRRELGLAPYSGITNAPDYFPSFHITIGNTK